MALLTLVPRSNPAAALGCQVTSSIYSKNFKPILQMRSIINYNSFLGFFALLHYTDGAIAFGAFH